MKYKVLVPQTGCINGQPWPAVGGVVEVSAKLTGMVESGALELVQEKPRTEKRPARKSKVETREG